MAKCTNFVEDVTGFVVVEATIILPIIFAIFAALVLMSIYLPTRAALQRSTQFAATALATEKSDAWLFFDVNVLAFRWENDKSNLNNVYVELLSSVSCGNHESAKAEVIVSKMEDGGLSAKNGVLTVEYGVVNKVIYQEIIVSASRTLPVPEVLSSIRILGLPTQIPISVTSTAVVCNGDEFVRNIDLGVDFVAYAMEKYELDDSLGSIRDCGNRMADIFGWKR